MGKLSRRCSVAPAGRGSAATSILGFLRRLHWESEVCTPCAWQTSSHGRAESGVWACAASRQLRRTLMPPLLAVETEPDDAIFQTAQMKHSFGTEASVSLDEHRSSSEVRGCRKRGVERCRMMGFIQEGGGPQPFWLVSFSVICGSLSQDVVASGSITCVRSVGWCFR